MQRCTAAERILSADIPYFSGCAGRPLARELKDEVPCPVCGSLSHPNPRMLSREQTVDQKTLDNEKRKLDKMEKDSVDQSLKAGSLKEQSNASWRQIVASAEELLEEFQEFHKKK